MPKHFQNNFEKGQKMTFLAPELAKITISEGEILTQKKIRVIYAFRAENTP